MSTKAQQVYEAIEAKVASGATKAEAFRQLAEEMGQPINSMRGAYYQHVKKLGGSTKKAKRRETTPQDAVESAKALLEQAVESIDAEIEQAKSRAEEAKAEFEAMKASAQERKQAISAKIEALGS